jgi:predicted nucleotide-binding protein (sugar kinase/HSP70/actin superfamily)
METETEKGNYVFIKEYFPEIREKVNELEHLQNLNESQQVLARDTMIYNIKVNMSLSKHLHKPKYSLSTDVEYY